MSESISADLPLPSSELSDGVGIDRRNLMTLPKEGFHQCWYPVALSTSLAVGEVKGMEFCDGRIALYRGENGVAQALSPYCAHMGADLSVGKVVGNNIQCAFHHWEYGADGRCAMIPSGDRIPDRAQQFRFPTEEKWGLIWVYYGAEPHYPVPSFPNFDEKRMVTRAWELPWLTEETHFPVWIFGANGFDFQHFKTVHNIQVDTLPEITMTDVDIHYQIEYNHEAGGKFIQDLRMIGTNGVIQSDALGIDADRENLPPFTMHMGFGAQLGSKGTRFFCVDVVELKADTDEAREQASQQLDMLQTMHTQILNEDIPVINSMRLVEPAFVGADKPMVGYFHWARRWPVATMSEFC